MTETPEPTIGTDETPERLTRTAYMKVVERNRALEDLADRLLMEADTDSLTGLLNGRGLERRTRGRDWGFYVAVDLDGFKAAQDSHADGHEYGDRVLQAFADFLLSHTRQGEFRARDILVGRKGGDEFLLWCETRTGARAIRDRIRKWESDDGRVTASAGIGENPGAADAACYLHKKHKETTR